MRKISICLLAFVLVLSVMPINIFAEEIDMGYSDEEFILDASIGEVDNEYLNEEVILFSEANGGEIKVYNNITAQEVILSIPDDTAVTLLKTENEDYSLIRYTHGDKEAMSIEGYIENPYIIPVSEAGQYRLDRNKAEKTLEIPKEVETDLKTDIVDNEKALTDGTKDVSQSKEGPTFGVASILNQEIYYGIGLKNKTHVYESQSTSSKKLKSYVAGSKLKYKSLNANWYEATVIISGNPTTGYIHKADVDNIVNKQETLQGVAMSTSTHVYANATMKTILKSYSVGSVLKFKTFTNNWYEATVYVNGKATKGYIRKGDAVVGPPPQRLQGYSQLEPTNIYASKSKQSNVLKNYPAGKLLKYQSHDSLWYVATVYVNGKAQKGYIYQGDVGNSIPNLKGIAAKQLTSVYSSTSRNSSKLKNYKSGQILKYRPYNSSWFVATVFNNGKAQTGYIHKTDVLTSNGKTIVIDAGHGGSDPGAGANGLREKDVTLDISKRVQKQLENLGYIVIMTRKDDTYLGLSERTKKANNAQADIFVSIHVNAGGGEGIETWKMANGPEPYKSNILASNIQNEVIKETNAKNRGVKDKNLHVNRESKMPSALIETGFIDTKSDADKLKQSSYKGKIAKGIVNGIKKFFQMF